MDLPSPSLTKKDRERGFRTLMDADDISLKRRLSAPVKLGGYGMEAPRNLIEEAVLIVAKRQSFHPIKDEFIRCHRLYLDSGKATEGLVEQLPQTFLGCPDNEFHRESSLCFMLGMVARTFEPGCKFDIVPIIRGAQGGGKGQFFNRLSNGYFVQLPTRFDDVSKMVEAQSGNLIGELGEMAGLRRETAEIAKDFITRPFDQLRLAYGRRAGTYARQSVLVGTSNLDEILHDPTGNRRFHIWDDTHSEDNPIDLEKLTRLRPMIWGEAYDRYLQMRQEQPHGDLWLDLRSAEARRQRDEIAGRYRRATATEVARDALEDWLDEEKPAHAVMLDESGMTLDGYEGDEMPMVRNLVNAHMAAEEMQGDPSIRKYQNFDVRSFGKALSLVPGLTSLGRCRRTDERGRSVRSYWYYRFADDGRAWWPKPGSRKPKKRADDLLD